VQKESEGRAFSTSFCTKKKYFFCFRKLIEHGILMGRTGFFRDDLEEGLCKLVNSFSKFLQEVRDVLATGTISRVYHELLAGISRMNLRAPLEINEENTL
jgi:hypothetical protein